MIEHTLHTNKTLDQTILFRYRLLYTLFDDINLLACTLDK